MEYFKLMSEACEHEGILLSEEQYKKFIKYKEMLQEWNKKINLTAITEDEDIIKKHFIDCIKAFKFKYLKDAKKIIDIGTGAGFPGIPVKIINENTEVVLLDSLNKRIKFLNLVIEELNLKNITAIHGRAEDFSKQKEYRENFDIAVSRAVANLKVLSEYCIPYVKKNGYFISLKGPAVEEELNDAQNIISQLGGKIDDIIQVEIENSDLKHNLVIIKKIKGTPIQFPRKSSVINKKPVK